MMRPGIGDRSSIPVNVRDGRLADGERGPGSGDANLPAELAAGGGLREPSRRPE